MKAAGTNEISISPLKETDIKNTQYILEEHIQQPPGSGNILAEEVNEDLEMMRSSVAPNGSTHFFVAKTKTGQVVGFIGYQKPTSIMLKATKSDPNTTVEISLLNVANNYQKEGIGDNLVRAVEEAVVSKGLARVILNSGPRYRESGWGFYDQIGYKRAGQLDNLYGPNIHAIVWQKELKERG